MLNPLFRRFARCLFLFVASIACPGMVMAQVAQATAPAAKPAATPAASPTANEYDPTKSRDVRIDARSDNQRGLIWEVKSRDGSNTAYLFGTIHVGKASFYPLAAPVQAALRDSSRIVVEADLTDQADAAALTRLMEYPKGETLDIHLPPTMVARLKVQLEKRRIPYQAVQGMRPVMLGGMLPIMEYVRLGYDMKHGLDLWLIDYARREKKPLLQIESQRAQIELLTGLPPKLQEAFLDNTLTVLEQDLAGDQVTGLVNAWQIGDGKLLLDTASEASKGMRDSTVLEERILLSRHPAMLARIEGYLASGEVHFVAVGSLHMVGPKGLVALLEGKGYKVKQL